MSGWLVPRQELTPDQLRAVELSPEHHRVVTGGPGSGKTLVLLHRARHLADTMKVPPERFLIVVFTKALAQYLRPALDDLDLPKESLCTFDSLCWALHRELISERRPWDGVNRCVDFAAIRTAVLDELLRNPLPRRPLDFVLVDEGQDLPPEAYDILRLLSWHVTVMLDQQQRIYDGGAAEAEILVALGLRSPSIWLPESNRRSPYIAALAARFLPAMTFPEGFEVLVRPAAGIGERAEKEKPLLFRATCPEEELARLAEVARERVARGERVAVLVPDRKMIRPIAEYLAARGIPVEVPPRRRQARRGAGPATRPNSPPTVRLPALDFATDLVKVMPYHSAKGLTFDTVLMPRLVDTAFRNAELESVLRLLFVGISRATTWVYMSTGAGREHPTLGLRVELIRGGPDIMLQEGDLMWPFEISRVSPGYSRTPETEKPIGDWL